MVFELRIFTGKSVYLEALHWASGPARGKPIIMTTNRGEALKKMLARPGQLKQSILRVCACPSKTLTKTCARQSSQPAGRNRVGLFSVSHRFTLYLWNTVESPSTHACSCFHFTPYPGTQEMEYFSRIQCIFWQLSGSDLNLSCDSMHLQILV